MTFIGKSNREILPFSVTIGFAIAIAIIHPGGTVFAQNASMQLNQIIVTARKRPETLIEAPLSVSVVLGDNMNKLGVTNLEQLSSSVPGLQVGRNIQTSNIAIRGIASGMNKGFEQSVGMYVDGIYQPRSRQFTQSLVDIQRIEILRGPQSTLFGKNTIAGAIKVESETTLPGDDRQFSLIFDAEPEQGTTRATASFSGSISDTLAARLTVRAQESDGYLFNHTYQRDTGGYEDQMFRLSLAWEPTDNFQAIAKIYNTEMEGDGIAVTTPIVDGSLLADLQNGSSELSAFAVIGTIAALQQPGFVAAQGSHEFETWTGNPNLSRGDEEETDSTGGSLRLNWNLDNYTFTSLTGYSDFQFGQNKDVDFQPAQISHALDNEDLEQLSQEFRIASNFTGPINFMFGMYFEDRDLSIDTTAALDGTLGGFFGQLPANSLNPLLPPLPLSAIGINSLWNGSLLAPGTPLAAAEILSPVSGTRFQQDETTRAVFAEFNYELSDSLTLDVGLRYSRDEKDVNKQHISGIGTAAQPQFVINPDGSTTGGLDPVNTALLGQIAGAVLGRHPHDQDLSRNEDHADPTLRLSWQVNQNTNFYLSWAQGYKSGGFNYSPDTANPDGSPGAGTEYEDEQSRSWEFGVRSNLLDNRFRVSATLFDAQLEDLQVTTFQVFQFNVGNAAEVSSRGFEFDSSYRLTDNVEVGLITTYLDSEFDSYANGPCTVAQEAAGCEFQDLSGRTTPFAPEWSAFYYADYFGSISNSLNLSGRLELAYKDDFFTNGNLDANALQTSYTKVNVRIALSNADDTWEVALYGRNLTDKATYTASLNAPFSAGILASWIEEPRIVGAQVRYSF